MGLSRAGGSAFAARLFARGTSPALALLRAAWPAAVGPELARRTEVLALEGTALRVKVPDVRWRKVLHRMQPEILARLRRVAGELAPRRLGFSEGGPAEGLDDGKGEARTPRGVFRSGAFPQTTEAGFTPAEGLDDGKGEARTPREDQVPELPESVAAAARAIDDPEIRARFERSAARYLGAFRR